MAKPDYEEVIKQRNAAREEVEALKKQIEELKASPPVSADGELAAKLGEALERVRVLEGEKATLAAQLESLRAHPVAAVAAAAATPEDSGPETDPAMGDLTPDYVRWRFKAAAEVEFRAIYAGREQYLPNDIREALGLPAVEPQAE